MPTWRNGKNALEVWLSGDYQSISATSDSRLGSSKVFDEKVLYSDVVRDLDSARTKFTLWDSTNNCLDLNADRDQFIERRFVKEEDSKCKTAFDIKATPKGVLRRSPHLPERYDISNNKVETVVDRRHKSHHKPSSKQNLRKRQSTAEELSAQPDWEMVISETGAITGFHIDSHGTGALIHQLFGVKVLCACPATVNNWKVFETYYLNIHPQDQ